MPGLRYRHLLKQNNSCECRTMQGVVGVAMLFDLKGQVDKSFMTTLQRSSSELS